MIINDSIKNILQTVYTNLMYGDLMTVYRQKEVVLENGSIGYIKDRIYNKVPCLLSLTIPDRSVSSYVYANPYGMLFKVFCSSNLDIKKGDYISCERMVGLNVNYFQGITNEPIRYQDGHQELFILDTAEGGSESFEDNKEPRTVNNKNSEIQNGDDNGYYEFF